MRNDFSHRSRAEATGGRSEAENWNLLGRLFQLGLEDAMFSPAIIVWFAIFLGLAFIGYQFMAEDLFTTSSGYNQLPTQAAFEDTGKYVAWLLWLLPIATPILYQITGQTLWLKVGIGGLIVDGVFDTMYRVQADIFLEPVRFAVELGIGLFQSFTIFTLGSEVAVSMGVTISLMLFPYAVYQMFAIFGKILGVFGKSLSWVDRSAEKLRHFLEENETARFFRPHQGRNEHEVNSAY